MRWIFFSPVVFILFGGICVYVGLRLLGFIRYFYPNIKTKIFWIPFAVLCCVEVLLIAFRSQFSFLRQFSSIWITVFLYIFMLFTLLVIVDAARLILYLKGKLPPKFNVYSVGSALVLCVGLIIYGASNARLIEPVNYNINIQDAFENIDFKKIRIVLVSDTHIGSSIGKRHIKRVVDEINRAQPDIVCFAGDIFDGNMDMVSDLQGVISELKRLEAPLGVYACLGNHDYDRLNRILPVLKDLNIIVLQDEVYKIMNNFYIIGRKDIRLVGFGETQKSVQILISGLPRESFFIMLDHRPAYFERLERIGINLVLSGHTHRGQIFPGTLLTRLIFKRAGAISYGHWQGETMHAIVTSGAGFWGPPIRIGTNSEVAIIDINIVE